MKATMILITLVLAVGCSGGQVAAQPAPSPIPTPVKTLAAEYVQMVAAVHDPGSKLYAALALDEAAANQASTKPLSEVYLEALTVFNAKLVSFQTRVSPKTQVDVQYLRRNAALQISNVQAILAAQSTTDWQAIVARWVGNTRAFIEAVTLVGADLGLSPAQLIESSPTPAT